MGEVVVGDGTGQVRGKGIRQAASDKADILVAINREPNPRGRGSDIGGFRERVIEIKLESVAELLSQAGLQGVVVRTADGTPSVHRECLIIEEFAGTSVESGRSVEEIAA